jgi:hypothetical protein
MAEEVRFMSRCRVQPRRAVSRLVGLALGLVIFFPSEGFAQTCEEELLQCNGALNTCLSNLADDDSDGELNLTDWCPGTPLGTSVDAAGCSTTQFCVAIPVSDAAGRRNCKRADWQGDEGGRFLYRPRDCRVDRGDPKEPFNTADDVCLPRP